MGHTAPSVVTAVLRGNAVWGHAGLVPINQEANVDTLNVLREKWF